MKKKILFAGFLVFAFILASGQVLAQTDPVTEGDSDDQPVPELYQEAVVEESDAPEEVPEDVIEDEQVSAEDLGVEEARILPDNPLYAFKRFARGVREAVTFNPIKKAELRLRYANEELADAQKLLDEKFEDEDAVRAATKAVERFERRIEKISDKTDKLKEKIDEDGRVDRFLDNVLDKQIKQQKVLEKVERRIIEHAPEEVAKRVLERVQDVRDRSAEHVAQVMTRVEENQERIVQRFDRVLDAQEGSGFKELRNLEVLKRIEDHVPEQAREAIVHAQENAFKRLGNGFRDHSAEDFERYTRHMGGDETRYMEIFDRPEFVEDAPEEIKQKMEKIKDLAARRLQHRVEEINDRFDDEQFERRTRDRMFEHLKEGEIANPAKIRVMQELGERMHFEDKKMQEEMVKHEDESVDAFIAAFPDAKADAERFRELSKKMADNPDPNTFRLIQDLERKVMADPEMADFIRKMEVEAKQGFAQKATQVGEDFFEEIISSNPADIEIFKQLQRDFAENPDDFFGPPGFNGERPEFEDHRYGPPPGFDRYFDRALDKQTEKITDYLGEIDNPMDFQQFQSRFDIPEEALAELKRRQGDFDDKFRDRRVDVEEYEHKQAWDQLEREFDQRLKNVGDVGKDEIIKEFDERRKQLSNQADVRRKEFFEKSITNDPFCDQRCQEQERHFFDERMRKDQERRRENEEFYEIEKEINEFFWKKEKEKVEGQMREDGNFFVGKCGDAESCEKWCIENPGHPECDRPDGQPGPDDHRRDDRFFQKDDFEFDGEKYQEKYPNPDKLEKEGFETGPIGDRDDWEKRGLAPMPSPGPKKYQKEGFETGPIGDKYEDKYEKKDYDDRYDKEKYDYQDKDLRSAPMPGSDVGHRGLAPVPTPGMQNNIPKPGLAPIPSPGPANDLEKTGLAPMPSP